MVERGLRAASLLMALSLGCEGVIGSPSAEDSPDPEGWDDIIREDGSFACDPAERPSVTELRRLTAIEYRNTLRDLFASELDALDLASSALRSLPSDGAEEAGFSRMDGRLTPTHADAYFQSADVLAQAAVDDESARVALMGPCASEADLSSACIDAFLDGFATRAFRRPLSDDERARYHDLDDGVRTRDEVVFALFFTALMSPDFLYHLELEGPAIDDDDYFTLDAYALANRLSFHFWQSMPDGELFQAAADGSLLTEDGYRAQVERIFSDARTHEATGTFYREWLGSDVVGDFPDTTVFNTFAEGEGIHDPDADHLQAMRDEIDALVHHYTWDTEGTMRDVLLSDLSFAQSPRLAQLYGVEIWDGVSDPPRFDRSERSGLLTRGAFLVTGEHETAPIHRGAVIRQRILCDEIAIPDPATLPEGALDPPEFSPDMSTRERWEEKTRNQPCAGCHAHINPLGFVLERYDALGRSRTHEQILDETSGDVLAEFMIDTTADVMVSPTASGTVSEPAELMEMIADSGRVEGCFARQYFRFTHAREETPADGCALERVREALARQAVEGETPGSLREALRVIALDPSFRQRVVGAVEAVEE